MSDFITYDEKDFPSHIHKLKKLYIDLFSGGKGFRAQLVAMVAQPLKLEDEQTLCLQKVAEYIHNSSLLHDDLIDQSPLRRGKTAAWKEYSPDHAVLAGDYLLAKVISLLSENTNLKLVSYTADVIMNLLEGEWLQDDLRGQLDIDAAGMERVHELKTASLKKWCLRAPFYSLGRDDESLHANLEEVGRLMGILFQRADDLIDYDIRNTENKNILGDHKSGYINSFAIFLLKEKSLEERKEFLSKNDINSIIEFVGRDIWLEKIEAFDKENQNLIKTYNENLSKVSAQVNATERAIVDYLMPLGHLLYWRK